MLKRFILGILFSLLIFGLWETVFKVVEVDSYSIGECTSNVKNHNPTNLLAFYYPWYGTPNVSGYWYHWNDTNHNPDNFLNGKRDIAATDYPLLGVYDSNNETLIEEHIKIAKKAGIDVFVVSWWGIKSFEDKALLHIKNVCEREKFKFTVYYENTTGVNQTVKDLLYLLNTYANSSMWFRIESRPVIFVYSKAIGQLKPQMWKTYGNTTYWGLSEDVRENPRYGIFVIEPKQNGIGYIENTESIPLLSNETYVLRVGISDIRNDCPNFSDVGFRIKIKSENESWNTLDERIVNFDDGWLDLSYNVSFYAGQNVSIRVESYDGGVKKWCSEWAAVDYFYIENSKGKIVSPEPYFDNQWKNVVNDLKERGYNPYFIMDFGDYVNKVRDFARYFLNFTEGIHDYNPLIFSPYLSDIFNLYKESSNTAHTMNKTFVATVMPGYDDTAVRSPGHVVDREDGWCYTSLWLIAKASSPDYYVVTSFNEWHEGTEIEPSLEYGYIYINLTFLNVIPEFSHNILLLLPFFMLLTVLAKLCWKKAG